MSSNSVFSGLEDLGFNNIKDVEIYKTPKSDESKDTKQEQIEKEQNLLYDKEVTCPVCGTTFKVRSVKTSSYRIKKKDKDFFIHYSIINPYFYDVWLCNRCGYASMKSDFNKIKNYQIDIVKSKISPKWHGRNYSEVYDVNIAIERYKLSLLNYAITDAKSSKKAMNCLKLAWMHRLLEDKETELTFLSEALKGFNDAYYNEDFPLYGMDRFTTMYLIGELNRRVGNNDEALIWFSNVITTPNVSQKLKEYARDQKDLIKQGINEYSVDDSSNDANVSEDNDTENFSLNSQSEEESVNSKRKGFFSKFFK